MDSRLRGNDRSFQLPTCNFQLSPLPNRTQTFGLILVLLLGAIAYLAITLPTKGIQQYHNASQHNAVLGYAYLAVVGLGVTMLAAILGTVTWRDWRNSVRRDKQDR